MKLMMYCKHCNYAEQKIVPYSNIHISCVETEGLFCVSTKGIFKVSIGISFSQFPFEHRVFWRETVSQLKDLKRLTFAIPSDTVE